MTDRITKIILRGDISGLKASMHAASASVSDVTNRITGQTRDAVKWRQGLTAVGTSAGKMGLVAAAGLGVVTKSAMGWETAWAGVTKTVDGSAKQMGALEGQLRNLAKTLPTSHTEIAAVAEAAGQLGVKRNDIAAFTKTMIDLGQSTNLSADEAATAIAQFTNVMGTAPGEVDNLGSALVALGNDGASTERDIIQMAQRIAGAAKTVGLSAPDVLAISNAVASMGIDVEAGGTAISRTLATMSKASQEGGKSLAGFAKISGVSAADFAKSFKDRPAEAFTTFIKGLEKTQKAGGNLYGQLKSIGLSDIRVSQALIGMASSGDLLTNSLDLGSDAWEKNTALTDEAGKRYGTAASKTKIALNGIRDNMIDMGDAALPVVEKLTTGIAALTNKFSDLPQPVKSSLTGALALTAGLGGTVYVASRVVSGVASMRQNLDNLGISFRSANKKSLAMKGGLLAGGIALTAISGKVGESNRALGSLTATAGGAAAGFAVGGPWGAAIGGAIGLASSFGKSNKDAAGDVTSLTATLDAQTGALTKNTNEWLVNSLNKATGERKKSAFQLGGDLGLGQGLITDAALGNASAFHEVVAAISVELKKDPFSEASKNALALGDAIGLTTTQLDKAKREHKNASTALKESAEANKLTADQVRAVGKAVKSVPKSVVTQFTQPGYEGAVENAARIAQKYNILPENVETILKALDYTKPQIAAVKKRLAELDRAKANPKITVNDEAAIARIRSLQTAINNVHGKTVAIHVTGGKGVVGGGRQLINANGSITDYYANGGFSEHHVAQIAPAGTTRVWNEPETGGEAYIPFAMSKRKRSQEIAMQTVQRLGGVAAFANGGMTGASSPVPTSFQLVSNRVEIGGDGLARLVDTRIEATMAGANRFDSAQRNARR